MHVSNDRVHTIFREDFLNQEQRIFVMELFADVEEAKQQQHDEQREMSTNPFQNHIPHSTLEELSNRISNLTEEQREFVDYAEEMISDSGKY